MQNSYKNIQLAAQTNIDNNCVFLINFCKTTTNYFCNKLIKHQFCSYTNDYEHKKQTDQIVEKQSSSKSLIHQSLFHKDVLCFFC